ncbi:Hypothetical predicted protein [Mytilus galloprovincialis]|uniref:Uncharacterized protein n=1 Tax=Mytilus galloprovincialis TaxID=29158 RepID=A0A8B6FRA8_MYTGA|nr:Hypothetical predicted protein [Mytilus galloprovincialis]
MLLWRKIQVRSTSQPEYLSQETQYSLSVVSTTIINTPPRLVNPENVTMEEDSVSTTIINTPPRLVSPENVTMEEDSVSTTIINTPPRLVNPENVTMVEDSGKIYVTA